MNKKEFIDDIVNNYNAFTTSDLQGVVEAWCMKNCVDDDIVLSEIYKRIEMLIV